jgi:hypothetical protein
VVLRFVKRLNYRDRVLDHLGALLLAWPRGRQFARDFPGLRATIRGHFEAGLSPQSSATRLAAGIIAGTLRQLGEPDRRAVLDEIGRLDREALASMASRRVAGGVDKPDPVAFATDLVAIAIFMARRMAEEGTLQRSDYVHVLREIEGAIVASGEPAPASGLLELFPLSGEAQGPLARG